MLATPTGRLTKSPTTEMTMAGSHSKHNSARVSNHAPAIASANPAIDPSPGHIREVSPSYCPTTAISLVKACNARTPVALPERRRSTMGYRPCYVDYCATHLLSEPPAVPFWPLQGRWLNRAGFGIGGAVRVLVAPGRLVLHVRSCRTCEIRATLSDRVMPASYAVVFSPLTLKFRSKAYERCIRTYLKGRACLSSHWCHTAAHP